jgi:hypothetical protein
MHVSDGMLLFKLELAPSLFVDGGQVWGWGYGGEGQLGLGSRLRVISTPQLIPCLDTPEGGLDQSRLVSGCFTATVPGNYIKAIACGGRHSAVITGTDMVTNAYHRCSAVLVHLGHHLYGLFCTQIPVLGVYLQAPMVASMN